jgi:hypothetical protein
MFCFSSICPYYLLYQNYWKKQFQEFIHLAQLWKSVLIFNNHIFLDIFHNLKKSKFLGRCFILLLIQTILITSSCYSFYYAQILLAAEIHFATHPTMLLSSPF